MCNPTKNFTIIKNNGKRKESFNVDNCRKLGVFEAIAQEFTNACNNATGRVIMKKYSIIIEM